MRRRPRLLWQLYLSTLLITLPALFLVAWLAYRETRTHHLERTREDLSLRARLVEKLYRDSWHRTPVRTQEVIAHLAEKTRTRYTIVLPDGRVIADSDHDPHQMENHADRPEIRAALNGHEGRSTRYSNTLRRDMMFLAVPVRRDGRIIAVVRTAIGLEQISHTLSALFQRFSLAGLVVAVLVALVTLLVAHRIVRPLRQMQGGAARFASGELRYRLKVPWSEEVGALAESMNQMAAQLDERIRIVTRQRNQLEAVLSSMIEAVLVVDARGRVLQANRAAATLFELDPAETVGVAVELVVEHEGLQQLLYGLLERETPVDEEIVLEGHGTRHLRVIGTRLRDAVGQRMGAMVVLHDVTQLKRLESIRKDFVANVSHELKTPITSIQGFVETLQDGAIDDPETARRFLDIMNRQAERLNAIIEDLLSLSRIELEGGAGQVALAPGPVLDVLRSAAQICETKADERGIALKVEGDPTLEASINAPLLEQAVINLIDNAIKYTDPGGHVHVSARRDDDDVVIAVQDDGHGIAPEHQPRIFERFYRVDKARSRDLGGTGLGLAIVKHITVAHRGLVSLESASGQGSTFRLRLPAERSEVNRSPNPSPG